MRAIITNFGSAGDVQPYLALIMEMHHYGHEVAFAFSPHFAPMIERHGVEFIPIGPDFEKVQYEIITTTVATPDIHDSADQMYSMFAPLVEALPQMFRELSDACRNADVLISGPLQPASRMIHELTGIPFVSIQEAHFGGGGTPAYQQATTALINPFREQFGLPPLSHPLTHDANSPQLALYAVSRHVLPPLPNWPPHFNMTGYFFFEDEKWQPYPELVEFLAAGEAPVIITFGSMTHDDPDSVTELVLEAIRIVGCRAIIQQGWSGLGRCPVPSNVHVAGFVPHTRLFQHASCVVHHGGCGTAAAAFRAGVPSVFVPHGADQPLWAQLAHEMGSSVAPIPFPELTADRLARAITEALTVPSYRKVAESLSGRIRAEPGVKMARELIEQLVYKIGLYQETSQSQPNFDRVFGRGDKINRRKQFQQQQRLKKREHITTHGED
jgi:sterol 3beta-glucosyltransferase